MKTGAVNGAAGSGAWAWRAVEHAAAVSTSATTKAVRRAADMLIGPSPPFVPLPEDPASRRHAA